MRALRFVPLVAVLCAFALAPDPITVFLAGDSTMSQKLVTRRPETGWGEALQQYFDVDEVRVENHARNGRSSRSFLAEGRWQAIVERLEPGDYVLIQFGHNDESPDKGDRYSPPDEFQSNLTRFVREARAKQATPVLLTPVVRRRFDSSGAFYDTHGEYPELVREVAAEQQVALIDLHRATERLLHHYGPESSKRLFLHLAAGGEPNYPEGLIDDTHFSPLGAEEVARLAVEGILEAGIGLSELMTDGALPRSAGVVR